MPGYPDIKTSFLIIKKIIDSGADILELSTPFKNPIADGPTLAQAHKKVLADGMTKKQIFNFYKKITKHFNIPIIVVEYADAIYEIGLEKYFNEIKLCKIDALILPDISLDELDKFYDLALKKNINLPLIITPADSDEKIKFIAEKSKGFVYCALDAGVTGVRKRISDNSINFIKRVKKITKLPLVAGFGISRPKHIKILSKCGANGFVTCSKVIDIINNNLSNQKNMMIGLEKYIKSMKQATYVRK